MKKLYVENLYIELNCNYYFKIYDQTNRMTTYEKIFVAVYLKIDTDGFMKPVAIEWADGKIFEIGKITDERNAPPEHTGGVLTKKYKIIINGIEKILYLDKQTNRWFVERLAGRS